MAASPHERCEELVQCVGINSREHAPDGGLFGSCAAGYAALGQEGGWLMGDPFTDRDERPGTRDHRGQTDLENHSKVMASSARITRIRHRLE